MTDRGEWQGKVGETWAREWRRTDRSFGQLTEHLLARTRDYAFDHALDIGCGAGELSLAIARGRPEVFVTGIDVSPQLVAVARSRADNLANLEFVASDAASWLAPGDRASDLLISRHGVMFFDDPSAGFAHLAAQAANRASLLFSCFRALRENSFASEVIRLLPDPPAPGDPHAPGPFAFADSDRVTRILQAGGWTDIEIDPFDFVMVVGSGDDPVADAVDYFGHIGPAARIAAELDTAARDRFFARLRGLAERYLHKGIVAMPAASWLVSARKR